MTILDSMTSVFDSMGEWIIDSVSRMTSMFYVPETGLTLIGTLAVCGLAVSIVFLLVNTIRSFLNFG